MTPLLLTLFAAIPAPLPLVDHADEIEINHLHRTDGCHTFTQVIFWEWDQSYGRHQIIAWRMMHDSADWPIDKSPCGKWRVTWREGGVLRRVMAGRLKETRTLVDPEVAEREILPREFRRGLTEAPRSLRNAREVW